MKSSLISFIKSLNRAGVSVTEPQELLRLFRKHKLAIYRNLDLFEMNFAQLCLPLLYARCQRGYRAEERPEFLLVTNGKRHFVLPLTSDKQAFMKAVRDLIKSGGKVMALPQLASMPLLRPNRYPEYLCQTEFLATLPGRRVKAYRHDVRKLEAMGMIVEEEQGQFDELSRMNKQWYADFESRKGFRADRFEESEAVIELACSGLGDIDLVRVFRAVITSDEEWSASSRKAGKLCGFLITCRMSEAYWACVLSRSLSEYSGLGHYMWQKAAQVYLKEGVPMENDNTGGPDPALCSYKQRFSSELINTYQLRGSKWFSRFL
jgi:hypothetical protein